MVTQRLPLVAIKFNIELLHIYIELIINCKWIRGNTL